MRFSWYLGPSPRQPTVVWPRRDAPPADRASGTKQRRYTAVSPSNPSIGMLLLAVVDNIFNVETMPFFDFYSPITQVVGFWAKSGDLGHRIPNETIPVTFCIFGLHMQMLSFLGSKSTILKLKTGPLRKRP